MPLFCNIKTVIAGLLLTCVAGCADFPELDDRFDETSRQAAYPDLVPVETLTGALAPLRIAADTQDRLEMRVAALRARADRLRGSVIDAPSRARLSQPVVISDAS